jgi:hypothetical protein
MARFLLDGRNPQSFRDALERFQEIGSEIGRVNLECWKTLLQTVKKGTAFHLAYDLVDETGRQLEAALIIEPGPMFTQVELAAFASD